MQKNTTLYLSIIFVFFVIAYFIVDTYDLSRSRTFENDIVKLDTSAINSIVVNPKSDHDREVELIKESNHWKVKLNNGEAVSVAKGAVEMSLEQLLKIKADRVVGKGKDFFQKYEVDSMATRVRLYENDKKTLDLVLGKLQVKSQYDFSSYFRLFDDETIYSTQGYLEPAFNRTSNTWRNNVLVSIDDIQSIHTLRFNYSSENSFVITKNDSGLWYFDSGEMADSIMIVKYLKEIKNTRHSNFYDGKVDEENRLLLKSVEIESVSPVKIICKVFPEENNTVITSSFNTEAAWNVDESILTKLFKEKSFFTSSE